MNRYEALSTLRHARMLAHAISRDVDEKLERVEAYLMPDPCEVDGYHDEVICGNCQRCERERFNWEVEWGDAEPGR